MKNCRNLTTAEVQMHLNGATMFVRPVKGYLTDSYGDLLSDLQAGTYTPSVVDKNGEEQAGADKWGAISGVGERCWPAPFQPGQVIYGREPWMEAYNPYTKETRPVTLSNHPNDWGEVSGWRSPASMPKSVARIFQRIDKVEVVRVQDVTEEQAKNFGLDIKSCPVGYIPSYQKEPHAYTFCHYYTTRFGSESWDRNDWIWLFTYTTVNSLNG